MTQPARKKPLSQQDSLAQEIALLKWRKRLLSARDSLIDFTCMTMPDPADPDNADASRYKPARHHKALAAALEEVEKGNILRLIITMPPRHGKSELASRRYPQWFLGRDPYRQVIFATYNEDFALDFGRKVRDTMREPIFQQIFPACKLKQGSQSAERIETLEGGTAVFVGRGGSLTGRGADLLLIDDPIKDREEADSKALRDKLWDWFTDVAMTRLVNESARVIIIMTRWHEDDLVGRLTDPKNPCFRAEEAERWSKLDLPAIAMADDALGRPVGAPLWPERFSTTFLDGVRRINARTFTALYQGRPTPDDGAFFKREWIVGYNDVSHLPKNMRWYGASDHAVSEKQQDDRSCLGCGGIDEDGVLWIPPDVDWGQFRPDVLIELMIEQMRRHNPLFWWAENEHISKSLGPFLRKRMQEERVYIPIEPSSAAKDGMTRAQAIRGRMAMKMVRFPVFAHWWPDAQEELLKFPNGRHDDFVSFLAHLGRNIDRVTTPSNPLRYAKREPVEGTFAWIKAAAKEEKRQRDMLKAIEGW